MNEWAFLARPASVDGTVEETGEGEIIMHTSILDPDPTPLKETPRHVAHQPSHGPLVCSGLGILSFPLIFFFFVPTSLHPHSPPFSPSRSTGFQAPAIIELIADVNVHTLEVIPVTMRTQR
jgi:hypothetical protein